MKTKASLVRVEYFSFMFKRRLSALRIAGTIPAGGKGLHVEQYAQVERVFSPQDVQTFGTVIGDLNPLHQEWMVDNLPVEVQGHPLVRKNTNDSTRILVHGMLVGSLFSCIFGTLVPGSVYLRQSLEFKRPVYANDSVVARLTITDIQDARRGGVLVTCDTIATCNAKLCVRGEAEVWLLGGEHI